ncbi:MAG: hypothetical protein IJ929_01565 [Prevotella sp.]|nr:hypothetical protein [Prevotella sp.]
MPLPTAIQTVADSFNNTSEEIFDLNGRHLPVLQKGLNIVRKNGKIIKIVKR